MLPAPVLLVACVLPAAAPADSGLTIREFDRHTLTDVYYAEGASFGDFNRDGHGDVVAGPYWYEGPAFERKHELYEPKPQNLNGYADNFFSFVQDLSGDGFDDVLVVGFPGTPAAWYENPRGKDERWQRHEVFDWVSNESPTFTQLVGDDRPELVCTREGRYGYVTLDWDSPRDRWTFTPISGAVTDDRFGHGLGVGDVDGDGKPDLLVRNGWYEQPKALGGDWPFHQVAFTPAYGGAQMYAYDVDGDGDNDVITSLAAHDYGLAWFEQKKGADGAISFEQHLIMGSRPDQNRYGVVFSEPHAVDLADIDGDGLKDIVTGKTYWSHHERTPSWHDGAVVYWFRLVRGPDGVDFVPHEADDDSGIGRQVVSGDVNGDGLLDIVSAGMQGAFLLTQRAYSASEAEYAAWLPKAYVSGAEDPVGVLPAGPDGKPLNLGFEDGTLKDWTAAGDAFQDQPVEGDIDPKRKAGEGKKAYPDGRFWVGGYERLLDDAPTGTLTSAPFRASCRYASFRVGGGSSSALRVELVLCDTGKVIFVTHGRDSEKMYPVAVDLGPHAGKRIFIRLVDAQKDGWGHINFDDFRLHEEPPRFRDAPILLKRARG